MRVHRTLATAAVVVAALSGAPDRASATPPAGITIVALASFAPPVMTWSSSGAFADAGTFEFIDTRWAAVPSPVVGTLHQSLKFTGAAGTFTVRGDLLLRVVSPGVLTLDGPWSVGEGTGGYARLRGAGAVDIALAPDPSVPDVGTFTGSVHVD